MTTVLRAREPRDLLSYVPFRLGFLPRESLVMVCLDAGRARVGLVARQDLPPAWSAVPSLARVLAALASRDGASSAVLVLYRSGRVPPYVVAHLSVAFRVAGVAVDDVFQVDDERYRCLTCDGPCCPGEGRPVSELQSSVLGAEMVLRGNVVAADRAALGDIGVLEGHEAQDVRRELLVAQARWNGGVRVRARRRAEALEVWDAALERAVAGDGGPLSPRDTARLVTAFQDVLVRDAILLRTVAGGRAAARALVSGAQDDPLVRAALEAAFGGGDAPENPSPPDPDLVLAVDGLLRHLVRAAGDERSAGPLSVLAWSAWWRGDGALADVLVDRLLAADPEHSLGLLLRVAVDQCVAPPWVRRLPVRPEAAS